MYGNKIFTTDTFNRRLKKYCSELSIPYYPSHGIRFTSASICHEMGIKDRAIQPLLGYSTLRMTQHYLRPVTTDNQGAQMAEIF